MGQVYEEVVVHHEALLGEVFVNHEALIFRRGRVYPQSFVAPMYAAHYNRPIGYSWFLLKNYWLRRGAARVPSGLWVIDNFSPDNYHHWLIDCLPRILHGEELYPQERVLLLPRYYQRQPYISFTLQAFPRIERIGWIGPRMKVRVERLAFVPRPPVLLLRPPVYQPDRLAEVARRVGALAGKPGAAGRIYFSRSDAGRRRATNERDVVGVLRAHDFEIIQIDPAEPWQQIRASVGANVIVGVHGAALSNLIFMSSGGRVLELRRPERPGVFFFDHYRPLAEAMGIEYRSQVCELAHEAAGYEVNNADLVVDLDVLRENLRNATEA